MPQTFRVRYSSKPSGRAHSAADVLSIDIESELDGIPEHLPPGVYIMYVEDLTAGQTIHWTRWPKSYRPGFGGAG